MFLSEMRGQQEAYSRPGFTACADPSSYVEHTGPDGQLITDCHALTWRLAALLDGIDRADLAGMDEQLRAAASLREADDQVFELIERIAATRATTYCGIRTKHAAAAILLGANWYDEPSPCRDALLLSFLRDATRLHYPPPPGNKSPTNEELVATKAVIAYGATCLARIEEVRAGFQRKDEQVIELSPPAQDEQDTVLLVLQRQERAAVVDLVRVTALSAAAIHTKGRVLQRLLDDGEHDTHYLRVDLSRSYLADLETFMHVNGRGRESTSVASSIWSTLSSKVRWLTFGIHPG